MSIEAASHDKCVCLEGERRGLEGHHKNIIASYLYLGESGLSLWLHYIL